MATSQDYLIAIALIEQNDVRAMPLGGKEIKVNLDEKGSLHKLGEEVILNLLLRVFQRSDEGPIKRVSEDKGLLLVQMHPKRTSIYKIRMDKRWRYKSIFEVFG